MDEPELGGIEIPGPLHLRVADSDAGRISRPSRLAVVEDDDDVGAVDPRRH
jgi:hypothetical protein